MRDERVLEIHSFLQVLRKHFIIESWPNGNATGRKKSQLVIELAYKLALAGQTSTGKCTQVVIKSHFDATARAVS